MRQPAFSPTGRHSHRPNIAKAGGYRKVVSEASDLVASGYEAFYAMWGQSPTLRQIWRQHVTGADYPEGIRSH